MTDSLALAQAGILNPAGLEEHDITATLDHLMAYAIDSADLYFQASRFESWLLEDGIVKEGRHDIRQGVGVRAMSGEKTGFACSDELLLPALTNAAKAARVIARSGGNGRVLAWHPTPGHALYQPVDPRETLAGPDKIVLLESVEKEARRQDPRVSAGDRQPHRRAKNSARGNRRRHPGR